MWSRSKTSRSVDVIEGIGVSSSSHLSIIRHVWRAGETDMNDNGEVLGRLAYWMELILSSFVEVRSWGRKGGLGERRWKVCYAWIIKEKTSLWLYHHRKLTIRRVPIMGDIWRQRWMRGYFIKRYYSGNDETPFETGCWALWVRDVRLREKRWLMLVLVVVIRLVWVLVFHQEILLKNTGNDETSSEMGWRAFWARDVG